MGVRTVTRLRRQGGFSIVELMVAVVLGLVALSAVGTVFVNANKTYTNQESLARLQENARVAIQVISRDLRLAGYFGCLDDVTQVFDHVNSGASGLLTLIPIEGLEDATGTLSADWQPTTVDFRTDEMEPGTDAITVRFLDPTNRADVVEPYMPNVSAALHIGPDNGFKKGDITVVTDCSSADVFQITGPDQSNVDNGILNHNSGVAGVAPGNAEKPFSKTYEDDAMLLKFNASRYFIKDEGNGPGLVREGLFNLAGGTITEEVHELVPGIENLQILYGEDDNEDSNPDAYRDADNIINWNNVVAARIGILARSIASTRFNNGGEYGTEVDIDTRSYDLDGDGVPEYDPPDLRVIRQAFVSTILFRNLR